MRAGEELDLKRLAARLAAELPALGGPLEVEQFPGGHSNLTYLVRVGRRELVLRRPPFGAEIKSAHDMGREFRILSGLWPVYPKVPRPLFYCEDGAVLGAPFYVMERASGLILRGARAPQGVVLSSDLLRRLSEGLVDELARLHALDLKTTSLAAEGRPDGYVARQVRGWTERYRNARTDDVPEAEQTAEWLLGHLPAESGAALLHGDFKYDNLVLDPADPARIVAVLDWEMATVGDPLMDLGTSLAYWVDPDDAEEHRRLALGPTLLAGNLSRRQVVERYAARSGRDLHDPVFYYAYGLFKIVVIAQQIYRRFLDGASRDPRFATMIEAVRVLSRTAQRAIAAGRIHGLG